MFILLTLFIGKTNGRKISSCREATELVASSHPALDTARERFVNERLTPAEIELERDVEEACARMALVASQPASIAAFVRLSPTRQTAA